MEQLILSHCKTIGDLRNFSSDEVPEFLFIKKVDRLWVFDQVVYNNIGSKTLHGDYVDRGIWLAGEKEGLWVARYLINPMLKWSEGIYRNHKHHGLWTFWWNTGHKYFQVTYKNGEEEGMWTSDGTKGI